MIKPLISYYGGKQRIASKIVPYLQAIPHTVRAIPFAGGLGVECAWPRPQMSNHDHYRVAINDHSELLINLYRVARDHPEEFIRLIDGTPYSQAEHREAVRICKNPEGHTPMRLAWAYYVNINQAFGNKLNAGWGTGVFSRNSSASWVNRKQCAPQFLERFKDVHIGCEDALKFIERWDSPQSLFYCDPPYPGSDQGHYEGYTLDDWGNLCDLLDSIQGSYVLSNYAQDREPQADQRVEIKTVSSVSGKGRVGNGRDKSRAATPEELGDRTRTEILWIKDRSHGMRPELRRLTDQVRQGSLLR